MALRTTSERDMLHRAKRVAIDLRRGLWVFEEGEQTVATHIEEDMRNARIRRRAYTMCTAGHRRPETMDDRHTEDADIESSVPFMSSVTSAR